MAEKEKKSEDAPKPAADKKKEKRGKRVRTGKKHLKIDAYTFFKVENGVITRQRPHCPRCGEGTYLAQHKGRKYCGRCHYTIFDKKE